MTRSDPEFISVLAAGDLIRRVFAHAEREFPRECCGMIHLSGGLRPCENAIDRFHQQDPVAYPRHSLNGYSLDFDDLQFLCDSLSSHDPVRAIYHSHPDGEASLSRTDIDEALAEGRHIYPMLLHLVIAVKSGRATEARLFSPVPGGYLETGRIVPLPEANQCGG